MFIEPKHLFHAKFKDETEGRRINENDGLILTKRLKREMYLNILLDTTNIFTSELVISASLIFNFHNYLCAQ